MQRRINRSSLPARVVTCLALVLSLVAMPVGDANAQGVVGGVYVDAAGMLRDTESLSQGERLRLLRIEAGEGAAGSVAAASRLRKVSLRRLEQAVAESHAAGRPLSADMRHLAGLQELRYVLFYPEDRDVVLAGQAEGWKQLATGDVVGQKSGRPALHLDDLIVALRYAFATDPADAFLGCSIEPTDEGKKRHDEFVSRLNGLDRSQTPEILRGMEQAMGPQRIVTYGVPSTSRFALQMLAADYRLKRLALAHDQSPSKTIPSYLDFAAKSISGGPQPQHRWWFVGHYDAIRHTPDERAWEFEGPGLRVDTAPTAGTFAPGGKAARPSRAATLFAEAATRGFAELAEKIVPFAELKNLVSLAVAAEIMRQATEPSRAPDPSKAASQIRNPKSEIPSWRPRHFLDEEACPIAAYPAPKQTPSLANVRIVGDRHWLFSISGGVEITPQSLAGPENSKVATDGRLDGTRTANAPPTGVERWWWD